MRRPSARTAFLAATALALGLPLLGWLGLRGIVGAHGFDTPDVSPPPPTPANLASGRFQRDAAEHFEHVFFGRTELLFLKNGLFDLASAGDYHSGFDGHVVQGRDGWLFEKPYLDAAFRTNLPVANPVLRRRTAIAVENLHHAFAAFRPGAPVAFVLAPSKAETLRRFAPDRYFAFGDLPPEGSPDPEPYRTIRKILLDAGFPFVEASSLAAPDADPRTLFPRGGTHWTVHWAARAVSAAFGRVDPSLPRPDPLPPVLGPGPDDPRDRDLAYLLNVPVPYRRGGDVHAHASFPPPPAGSPGARKVYVVGDSFGEQVVEALVRSGLYAAANVVLRFNEIPPAREFREAAAGADAILFVYSAPSLAGMRLADTAETLANALRPIAKPGRRYAIGRSPFAMDEAWRDEEGGRTVSLDPGAEGVLEIPLVEVRGRPASASVALFGPDGAEALSVAVDPACATNGAVLRVPVRAPAGAPLRLSAFRVDLR